MTLPPHPGRAGARLPVGDGFATVLPDMDFETASEAGYVWVEEEAKWIGPPGAPAGKSSKGLGAVGVANYAQHPSTRVLSFAYDLKDGRGRRWWRPGLPNPADLFAHIAAGGLIEAHNSAFEHWIWKGVCTRLYGWPALPLHQMRCSAAKSRAWAMPGALENVGAVLTIEHQKDPEGDRLLKLFSVPQKPTKKQPLKWLDPATHPEGPGLYAYNDRDIVAESEVSRAVPDLSPTELSYWLDDQEINNRGVHIDVTSMHACCAILDQAEAKYNAELQAITGGISATELAKLIGWLHGQGVHTDSLDEENVAHLLGRTDMPPTARRAVEIRSLIGSASVKKVRAMRNTVTAAGTLHDTYVFFGAHTGRPTGQGVQTTNLPKAGPNVYECKGCGKWHGSHTMACPWCGVPTLRKPKSAKEWNPAAMMDAFEVIRSGDLATVERYFGDALWTVAGCLRGLFVAGDPDEWEFVSSDFTAIEGVVIACLAGEQWRIDAYANPDPKAPSMYLLSAERMFGVPVAEMLAYPAANGGQHHPLRQKGKGGELGLGFGGWINALRNFGVEGTDGELKATVLAWRKASPALVHFWGGQQRDWQPCEPFGLEGMAVKAIQNPGVAFPVMRLDGTHSGITFQMIDDALYGYAPGGSRLTYHRPRLHDTGSWKGLSISYEGWNSNPKNGAMGWMRRDTYSGKLAENFTQHVARNIQMGAIRRLKAAGYDVRMHTYDENVARVRKGWGSVEEMEAIMCDVQPWARGWPIKAAGGWRGWRYRKG